MRNPSGEMLKNGPVLMLRCLKFVVQNNCEGVFCYSKRTPFPGLIKTAKNQLYGYIDATYLSEEGPKSRYGYAFFLNGMISFGKSTKLPRNVLSSAESEYNALSWGARDGIYCRILLGALGYKQNGPTQIGQDSSASIQLAENPGQNFGKMKFAAAELHWVQEQIELEKQSLIKVPGAQ